MTALDLTDVAALRRAYGHLDSAELLEVMIRRVFPGRLAVISSFGAEAAVLLQLVARVDPATPVLFLDTGELFDETIAYRAELAAVLGLTDMRVVRPAAADLATAAELWRSDHDRCCHLRKVLPLARVAAGFAALVDGRKSFHGGERGHMSSIEAGADGLVKISPLATWSSAQVDAAFQMGNLPRHPLSSQGYASIGCWPCTRPVAPGEPVRAGRWAGAAKTECGIHTARWAT